MRFTQYTMPASARQNKSAARGMAQIDNDENLAIILAMVKWVRFDVILDDAVAQHFAAIERKDHSFILETIEQQLSYTPLDQTRNRKPMRVPNTVGATWELRCGINNRYRIFYDVAADDRLVVILAVGRKVGNRLYIGNEEFFL